MKNLRKLLSMTTTLLVLIAAAARGQSALDGFDPNANGPVNVVVAQPDGKILLGGQFTTLSPNGGAAVTRSQIAPVVVSSRGVQPRDVVTLSADACKWTTRQNLSTRPVAPSSPTSAREGSCRPEITP